MPAFNETSGQNPDGLIVLDMKEQAQENSDEILQSDEDMDDDSGEDFVITKSKRKLKE